MPYHDFVRNGLRQRALREGRPDPFAPMKPPRGRPSEFETILNELLRTYTPEQLVARGGQRLIEQHCNRRTAQKVVKLARQRLGAQTP